LSSGSSARHLAPVPATSDLDLRIEDTTRAGVGLSRSGTSRAWPPGKTTAVATAEVDARHGDVGDWVSAYGSLVEANIAAAAHLTGGADRDRELGELLAGFLASPLEVEP
jgi:hypothetical protein